MSTHNLRTTHCVLCTRVYDTICDIYALWHVRLCSVDVVAGTGTSWYSTYDVIVKYTVQTTLYSSIESFETAAIEHCALRRLK